nr:ApaG domain [FCB group bacterium]
MDTTSKVQAETAGFIVSVVSDYDEILSNPLEPAHFYNYKINIFNKSGPEAQLISRYWQITDANGIQNEVR